MKKLIIPVLTLALALAACAADQPHNPKDIPVDTGAQPQSNVIVSGPPGTMGHGKF